MPDVKDGWTEMRKKSASQGVDFFIDKFWDKENGGFVWYTNRKGEQQDIRRFAASVLDFAWIACGRAEVFFEHIYPWDRAAGIVIVKEAGGKVGSFDGGEVPIMGFHDVIAGVPEVVDEVVQITSSVFNEK